MRCVMGFALAAPLAGCTGTRLSRAGSELPRFDAVEATLFDDTFAPELLGDEPWREGDTLEDKLVERARHADMIVTARIVTVTRDRSSEAERFQLELELTGPALAGIPPRPLLLEVGPGNASYALVRSEETTLVGRALILLARRYDADGRETMHWRAETDSARARSVVMQARASSAGGSGR